MLQSPTWDGQNLPGREVGQECMKTYGNLNSLQSMTISYSWVV